MENVNGCMGFRQISYDIIIIFSLSLNYFIIVCDT